MNRQTGVALAAGAVVLAAASLVAYGLLGGRPAATPGGPGSSGSGADVMAALQAALDGRFSLDTVRVVAWWPAQGQSSGPIPGDTYGLISGQGFGVWKGEKEFELPLAEVAALLRQFRDARFGEMPLTFPAPRRRPNEAVICDVPLNMLWTVALRVGNAGHTVIQNEGERSEELARLAAQVRRICEAGASKGIGAASVADGVRKVAAAKLRAEALTLRYVFYVPESASATAPWAPKEGRRLTVHGHLLRAGTSTAAEDHCQELSGPQFDALVRKLIDQEVWSLPSPENPPFETNWVQVRVLDRRMSQPPSAIVNWTPQLQQRLDRLHATLEPLWERAMREGEVKTPHYNALQDALD